MYSKVVLNIFNSPKNIGRISKPDGIANCYNETNSAHVEFSLRIESGVIIDCKFRAQANPYIIAICSTITEMVKGKMCSMLFLDPYSIKKELQDETDMDIMFCIDCLKLAIQDYKEKLEKVLKSNNKENETIDSMGSTEEKLKNNVEIETLNDISNDILEDDFGQDFIEGLFDDEFFEED